MPEETKEAEAQGKEGGKKKIILFVLIGIFILGIAAGVVFFLGGKKKDKKGEKIGAELKHPKQTFFVTLDPVIVNLLDPTGKRYLQIQISLEVSDKKLEEEINKKIPVIKDTINTIIGEKTVEDVLAPNAKEEIKKELLEAINKALGEDVVLKIYILQFIVE